MFPGVTSMVRDKFLEAFGGEYSVASNRVLLLCRIDAGGVMGGGAHSKTSF